MRKRKIILIVLFSGFLSNSEAQKGEVSIAAGMFFALPSHRNIIYQDGIEWNTGVGLEGIGQYNFTEKSAAVLQIQLTRFFGYSYYTSTIPDEHAHTSINTVSLKAGYRYQFTTSGFYANVLAGGEFQDYLFGNAFSAALGIGKRFTIKDLLFLDTGLDYTGGFINRYHIKAVFSLIKRPKAN